MTSEIFVRQKPVKKGSWIKGKDTFDRCSVRRFTESLGEEAKRETKTFGSQRSTHYNFLNIPLLSVDRPSGVKLGARESRKYLQRVGSDASAEGSRYPVTERLLDKVDDREQSESRTIQRSSKQYDKQKKAEEKRNEQQNRRNQSFEGAKEREAKKKVTEKQKQNQKVVNYVNTVDTKLKGKDIDQLLSQYKGLFREFSKPDTSGPPAGMEMSQGRDLPPVLRVNDLVEKNYSVFGPMKDAFRGGRNSRGDHGNAEQRYPIAQAVNGNAPAYEEFDIHGIPGGARIVIDHTSGREYFSAHYVAPVRIDGQY